MLRFHTVHIASADIPVSTTSTRASSPSSSSSGLPSRSFSGSPIGMNFSKTTRARAASADGYTGMGGRFSPTERENNTKWALLDCLKTITMTDLHPLAVAQSEALTNWLRNECPDYAKCPILNRMYSLIEDKYFSKATAELERHLNPTPREEADEFDADSYLRQAAIVDGFDDAAVPASAPGM